MDNSMLSQPLQGYKKLMQSHPEYFNHSALITIETDFSILSEYEKLHNTNLGIVYDGLYSMMVVDLIKKSDSTYYTYERVIQKNASSAVVILPMYKDSFVLLKQYRHIVGEYQYAIPRGFGEAGLTSLENAKKELFEEIGSVHATFTYLGNVVADSGLCGTKVSVFLAKIEDYNANSRTEGIEKIELVNCKEMQTWIGEGKITDGFTLSAYALYVGKASLPHVHTNI